ncbi:MAG: hypothetical protein Q7T44_03700 [Parvibaculum sp.]|nr:hypothetical protein [Parvibaculum sp.]
MLSPANTFYSEDYWRDRCGMPPRVEGFEASGQAFVRSYKTQKRSSAVRVLRALAAPFRLSFAARPKSEAVVAPGFHPSPARIMQDSLRARLHASDKKPKRASRISRRGMIKFSVAMVGLVWVAGLAVVSLRPAPINASLGAAYVGIGTKLPEPTAQPKVGAVQAPNKMQFDSMLISFADANEAGLVALRGYLITGSAGFKDEWKDAMARLDAAQMAIEIDSRDWTDGARIMQLRDMRKSVAALKAEQATLVGLVLTTNRYPGLRLYRDDTERALAEAETLIDVALASVVQSNRTGAATRVDSLAHVRSALRALRASINVYLPSSAKAAPTQLMAEYASFRSSLPTLAAMRNQVGPDDQARLDKAGYLLSNADMQLQHIMALKPTPRWDYADFAFKQKVMPLSEKISSIIAGWRA